MKAFYEDRPILENKYHNVDEPFDPLRRFFYHGYDYDESTGLSDGEMKAGLDALDAELASLPHPIARAKALKYVLEHTRIDINPHDCFVGIYNMDRFLSHEVTHKKWSNEVFGQLIPETNRLMEELNRSGAVSIWPDYDHVIPDWDSLMRLGFSGLKQRAADYRKLHEANGTLTPDMAAHFTGIDILYGAIPDFIDRLYRLALTKTHDKAKKIAPCLKQLRDGAPTNSYEAMQLIYLYFMISEHIDSYQVRSLGNGLDATLLPFYERDLASGTYTKEELRELLAYFMFQWQAIGNYWGQPFYLGGTNSDGSTKYNELSYDILDVYDEIELYNPKIQLKIHQNTPDRLLNKALDMVRRGKNSFVFVCEPGMIKAVMSYGATYEEALHMDIRGCYETGVKAKEVCTATGYVNALKPIEYVFSCGYDRTLQKQFGPATEAVGRLKTFDDFYAAVIAQWGFLIESTIQAANSYEAYLSYVNPSILYSATIEDSLKKGRDAYQDGVKFNNSAILNCGLGTLTDAVMAVKTLVYDEQVVTLEEFRQALEQNWAGYEDLRLRALKCSHKYGNGDPEADRYASALSRFFAMKVNNRPNARGGVYKAILHSARQYVWQGERTGATPDGRYAGEEISKNASPTNGMDKYGVTALIRSALNLLPYTYPESFCLDVMLHPTAVAGEEGLQVLKSLLTVYLKGDGMSIQFNIFDAATLRDAQENPNKYRNLQVRVCGWNVLWNNLSKKEQDAYILRCEEI